MVSPLAISMFSKDKWKKLCNNSRTITRFHNSEQHTVPDFKSRLLHLDSVNDPAKFWSSAAKSISWISPVRETMSKKTLEVEGCMFE
jgi:hypothetical protein